LYRPVIIEPGIDGHEVIVAVELKAMSREEEKGSLRCLDLIREEVDFCLEIAKAEIDALDDPEIQLAQGGCHRPFIIGWIGERGILVSAIADHERHALSWPSGALVVIPC